MPGIARRVKTDVLGSSFHHKRDGLVGEPTGLHPLKAIQRPEHGPILYMGGFQPGLK